MATFPFEYARAGSVEEALSLLSGHDGDAKLLAGGHSLIPAMKLRLSAPSLLVDIGGLRELSTIEERDGRLYIGAMTTHRTVELSDVVRAHCTVLSEAAGLIGDPLVRNRGTIGGSLAHADPAADYPALMLALNADIELAGPAGRRTVAAGEFFTGMFETALEAGEMITRVLVPVLERGTGAYYAKFPNPASRYAVVGVAAVIRMSGGTCREARVGVTGATPVAFRATNVEEMLVGTPVGGSDIDRAVTGMVDPADLLEDLSGSAEYRAHLCEVMTRKALLHAAKRAQ